MICSPIAKKRSCSFSPRANRTRKPHRSSVLAYTIETHRSRLMQKLNLHSTADIVLYAVRKRIIQ